MTSFMASPEAKISSPIWMVGRTPVNWRVNISLKIHCTSCYIPRSNCPRNLWQSSGSSLTGSSIHLELADSSPTRRCSPKNSQEFPVKKEFSSTFFVCGYFDMFPQDCLNCFLCRPMVFQLDLHFCGFLVFPAKRPINLSLARSLIVVSKCWSTKI